MLLHYFIIRKEVLMDQLRSGLKDVNVLEYIEKYPVLFQQLFVHSESEITADATKQMFRPNTSLDEKEEIIWGHPMSFIDGCSKGLFSLVLFITRHRRLL